jgi:hypothetical protein
MNSPSSRRPMKAAVARSKTRARFIFGLNWKSKVSKSLVGIAETRLLVPPLQQTLAAAGQFVGHQDGDQVDGGHGFALCLQQARFHVPAMPLSRSWRRAPLSSIRFMIWIPQIGFVVGSGRDTAPVRG